MTIEQVIKDIISGESTKIYLCPKGLWWTHLESDLANGKVPFSTKDKPRININPLDFINKTKLKPNWYGKHKLEAFMKAHAKNCEGHNYNQWKRYNDLIDANEK